VNALKARGVHFLQPPATYYANLQERLKTAKVTVAEDMSEIARLGILVDYDDAGYLLQIFTKVQLDSISFKLTGLRALNSRLPI
jgi:4-hydroxyphenylpyruvate dioxygenase